MVGSHHPGSRSGAVHEPVTGLGRGIHAGRVRSRADAPAGAVSLPAKVYFDVGSAAVGAEGSKTMAKVADLIKKDNLKVAITGYTDKTGDVAKNEELAKSRALAVRDALKTGGVAEANLAMKPPLFVEAGAGGSDAEARRVEINQQ